MKILYFNPDLTTAHIAEALVMAGLPKSTTTENIDRNIADLTACLNANNQDMTKVLDHIKRGISLGSAKAGSGHDCFLKGCVVTAVISAPAYMWPQIQRYHFLDIVSSQSKMHRITQMDLKSQCNAEVHPGIIEIVNTYIDRHNAALEALKKHRAAIVTDDLETTVNHRKEEKKLEDAVNFTFREILNNTPHGIHLAAGIVTNYLQLKTMEQQRKAHKLEEWHDDFIQFLDTLPYYKLLTGRGITTK